MLMLILFICCVILLFFYKYVLNRKGVWEKRGVIQFGEIVLKFALSNRSLGEVLKEIYDLYPNEPHVGIFQGSRPGLLLRNLENIKTVFTSGFQNFHSRGIVTNPGDVLADNLLFIDDYHRWKLIRQKVSPIFTTSKLKNMFYIMERCARDFVATVKNGNGKQPFDLLYIYATASIGAAVFGINTQNESTMDSPFLEMSKNATFPSIKNNFRFTVANILPNLFKLFNMKTFGEYESFFVGAVKNVIHERQNDKEKRNDFIDLCLDLKNERILQDPQSNFKMEATEEMLAAQAFFFFLAGTDTTANAMHFTLLELSNNLEILKKLHQEIDEIFERCKENLTYNDMEKFYYLEMVINESMRKYPPIGSLQRRCTEDITLPVGNVRINKNELVVIPIYAIHSDAVYFPNPEIFDPERFAPENFKNLPKYCYIPFGEGNRICIGARFARLQVKVGLAWFLRRFTLRPLSSQQVRFEPSFFSLRAPTAKYEIILR